MTILSSFPLKRFHLPAGRNQANEPSNDYDAFRSVSDFDLRPDEEEKQPKGGFRKGVRQPSLTQNTLYLDLYNTVAAEIENEEANLVQQQKCEATFRRCQKKAATVRHHLKRPMYTKTNESESLGAKFAAMEEASACYQFKKSSEQPAPLHLSNSGSKELTKHQQEHHGGAEDLQPSPSSLHRTGRGRAVQAGRLGCSSRQRHVSHRRRETDSSESSDNTDSSSGTVVTVVSSSSSSSSRQTRHRRVLRSRRLAPSP